MRIIFLFLCFFLSSYAVSYSEGEVAYINDHLSKWNGVDFVNHISKRGVSFCVIYEDKRYDRHEPFFGDLIDFYKRVTGNINIHFYVKDDVGGCYDESVRVFITNNKKQNVIKYALNEYRRLYPGKYENYQFYKIEGVEYYSIYGSYFSAFSSNSLYAVVFVNGFDPEASDYFRLYSENVLNTEIFQLLSKLDDIHSNYIVSLAQENILSNPVEYKADYNSYREIIDYNNKINSEGLCYIDVVFLIYIYGGFYGKYSIYDLEAELSKEAYEIKDMFRGSIFDDECWGKAVTPDAMPSTH